MYVGNTKIGSIMISGDIMSKEGRASANELAVPVLVAAIAIVSFGAIPANVAGRPAAASDYSACYQGGGHQTHLASARRPRR